MNSNLLVSSFKFASLSDHPTRLRKKDSRKSASVGVNTQLSSANWLTIDQCSCTTAIRIQALARGNKERERLKMDAPETEGKGKLEKDNEAPETEGKDKLENGNEVETVPEEQLLRQKKFVK